MLIYLKRIIKAVFYNECIHEDLMKFHERLNCKASLWHLRDQLHNLPKHLNLDEHEEAFLSEVYLQLPFIFSSYPCHFMISEETYGYLESKYVGSYAGHTVNTEVTSEDFSRAKNKDCPTLLKISKCILFNNFDRYQKKNEWYRTVDESKKLENSSEELGKQLEEMQEKYSYLMSELTSVGLNPEEFACRDKDIYMQRSMRLLGALIGGIDNDSVSMEALTRTENLIVKEYLSYLPNYDLELLNHYFELKQKDEVTDELCEKLSYLYRQHGNTIVGLKRFFSQRDWDKK
jgi:hypothetical protein